MHDNHAPSKAKRLMSDIIKEKPQERWEQPNRFYINIGFLLHVTYRNGQRSNWCTYSVKNNKHIEKLNCIQVYTHTSCNEPDQEKKKGGHAMTQMELASWCRGKETMMPSHRQHGIDLGHRIFSRFASESSECNRVGNA